MTRSLSLSTPLPRKTSGSRPKTAIRLNWQQLSIKGMLLRKKDHLELSSQFLLRVVIGRDSFCDLQLLHPSIADFHAIIFYEGRKWYIVALNPAGFIRVENPRKKVTSKPGRQIIKRGYTINLSDEFSMTIS